ncbi:hypothetical protein [Nannocystis bainbridge]|uniref:Uncharacterized protein n=1 Tax=Nannocystis bainbridge TaxID=2995303 RepID=A0ABT5DPB3_9BACT|nr:hypothetical protein [Nannocystis bainbridge]MDC0715492.1 hypothetical protein [Nannocystis bainbridge]
MTAWRTLACSVSLLCLAPACGDDGGAGGFSTNNPNTNSNTNQTTDTSSGTDTSTGAPGTSTTTGDPTTGPDTTSTTVTPTTNGPTSTTLPDTTTTGDPDTSTSTTTTTQTTDPAGCGNGNIDPNEQCDGGNLNGFTCESLGNAGGQLGCDPVTCTFDTSLCMGNSSSGTSG